jgi:coenzyme PQQ precursor peptide PqqA
MAQVDNVRGAKGSPVARSNLWHLQMETTMKKWHTPRVSEVCIGLEINDYLPAEL